MRALIAAAIISMTMPSANATEVLLHAAGSLREALTEVAKSFEAGGNTVRMKYGPSGTLRDEIAGGAKAEVFAHSSPAMALRRRGCRTCRSPHERSDMRGRASRGL